MRVFSCICAILFIAGTGAHAQTPPAASTSPPFEVADENIDMEVAASGEYWVSRDIIYRPLSEQGAQALRQFQLSYTQGYEVLQVQSAFTLKKDGTRIPVDPDHIMYGHGQTSRPGYADTQTVTVVFPNVEVGDRTELLTTDVQKVPWFAGVFAANFYFPPTLIVRKATIAIIAPSDLALNIDMSGLDAGPVETLNGKTRHSWSFHNDTSTKPESDAVQEIDDVPHLGIATLSDYRAVAHIYADLFQDKAIVTPKIRTLADSLTRGIADRRAKARAIYDWVSSYIKYVAIVLGAGGFTPHQAEDVLANSYGDCKDHVMLLEALLAAEGIKSSAVLIRAGTNDFRLPKTVSPFLFNHVITYVPEFQLYLDSTAQYAAFGVLPYSDAGKTVLLVQSGEVAHTPPISAANSTIRSETVLKVNADGSADGDTRITSTGAIAVDMRSSMASLPPDDDSNYFRAMLGPGSDGKLQRGDPANLSDAYSFSAHYRIANFATLPGPGAFPSALAYKPFSFSLLIGGNLPPERSDDYLCPSLDAEEDVTLVLPPGVSIGALPPSQVYSADQVELASHFENAGPATVRETEHLRIDHPKPVCSAAYYAGARPDLAGMLGALRAQILYK